MKKTSLHSRPGDKKPGKTGKIRDLKGPELTDAEAERIVGGFSNTLMVHSLPSLRLKLGMESTVGIEYGFSGTGYS